MRPETIELKCIGKDSIEKGRLSTLRGNKESAISGKQKDNVQREMLAASTMEVSVEKLHNRPLLSKTVDTK